MDNEPMNNDAMDNEAKDNDAMDNEAKDNEGGNEEVQPNEVAAPANGALAPEPWELELLTDLSFYGTPFKEEAVGPNDFQLLKLLGIGAFGRVFLVRKLTHTDAGKLYAMKIVNKTAVLESRSAARNHRMERVALHVSKNRPFIVGLQYAFQSASKLYIVMDFVQGGDLYTHLMTEGPFVEARVRFYIAELVVALEELHKLNILYRDIKLENVMLDGSGHVVLADLGMAKFLNEENSFRANSFCGTVEYVAPEVIEALPSGYTWASDWWSLGILTFMLLTGAVPFETMLDTQESQPLIPDGFSDAAKDFVLRSLEKDELRRLGGNGRGAAEIKAHPFFQVINWKDLKNKLYVPPFQLALSGEGDLQNFSTDFTGQQPVDPECEAPTMAVNLFHGYTYVAPYHVGPRRPQCQIEYSNPGVHNIPPRPQDLELSGYVRSGTFGRCYIAEFGPKKLIYMAKIVPQSLFRPSELDALLSCGAPDTEHPGIVTFYAAFRDECDVWIITRLLGGEELTTPIYHYLLSEHKCRTIFQQMVRAVRHIHSKKFIHGDIKPENVVFVNDNDLAVNLVDFGNASYDSTFLSWNDTPRYTLDYAPPELLSDPKLVTYTPAVDVYGLGATLYTMLVGHAPFRLDRGEQKDQSDAAHLRVKARIQGGSFNQGSDGYRRASLAYQHLVTWCLHPNPVDRPTLEQIEDSLWIEDDD
ncbi:chromosomal serine/threonine-protein kinase JIL-1-like [Drosophila obscura]|uniref:chromosomal serine/threonine-protein kinase JIL-1-like n=1 Tax=Drosophila obscura TaxID=7282 RepID=UPI001BB1532B|nr:chromosomal serine/threonine-protein kinase JIL-1-like [Drosophila obscura]